MPVVLFELNKRNKYKIKNGQLIFCISETATWWAYTIRDRVKCAIQLEFGLLRFHPHHDQEQSSPSTLLVLIVCTVWRNWQVISSWEQSLLNDHSSPNSIHKILYGSLGELMTFY